ncbi:MULTISPECIES: 2-phosphosulfolactate phosphatase [Microbacterium]|uniref:2-phosphosulfolactate phosphatase n=1 Tax=Microbacterium TaxID=33882 RepID=UPI000CCEE650|nr:MULTISPECIES: 2-phosphosulfolactate phosphatase [Microbacterium]MDZ5145728.1 2-phosphosulfolactate phosphatase [Microbacterium testaceum]PNW09880.1 phosphosulfolactate phosphohydrolase [Microbacterium testaceum]REC99894.1 2-phosphosulfolactate phosphatase [Microbacterium sp. AG157]
MPSSPALAQSDYQVRLDWGRSGLERLAPAPVVIVVQTLGLSLRALDATESGETMILEGDPTAELALAAGREGAHVVVGGLRNAAAVAAHVLEVQRTRGERTGISIIAAGSPDADGLRFAVEDLLGAGAVVAALGDLGIDHASPDAAVAGEGFRALAGAARHLLTASGTGRALAAVGAREAVLSAAARDAASVVPIVRDGSIVTA